MTIVTEFAKGCVLSVIEVKTYPQEANPGSRQYIHEKGEAIV